MGMRACMINFARLLMVFIACSACCTAPWLSSIGEATKAALFMSSNEYGKVNGEISPLARPIIGENLQDHGRTWLDSQSLDLRSSLLVYCHISTQRNCECGIGIVEESLSSGFCLLLLKLHAGKMARACPVG